MFSRNISKLVLSNNFKSNKLIKYCFHANLIQLNQNIYSQSINTHLIKLNDVQTPLLAKLRYKSRNKKSGDKEASIETDDEDEDDESNIDNIDTSKFQNGFKITKRNLASLRCDLVLAAGLGVSRNKIEDKFYGGKIRYNGQKLLKKAQKLKELDTIDLIDNDEVQGELTKRVLLYKLLNQNENNGRINVILVTWKGGINPNL